MDYVVNINGMDIIIETHPVGSMKYEDCQQRKRLLAYYEKLLQVTGKEMSPERDKALKYLVDYMTEECAKNKADDFEKRRLKRLMAYANAINAYYKKTRENKEGPKIDEDENNAVTETADALVEVLDATIDDADNQEIANINGNKFIYEKGSLTIGDYAQKLFDIGEKTKGNTWSIYIDEEGELVIY